MSDVVSTFGRGEEFKGGRDQGVDVIERTRARGAEERFQFRERLFDRIEIRTVRRQESERGAGVFNGRAGLRLSVDGEVIEHDHVAGPQRRHEHLVEVGQKAGVVDRPIKHGGRGEAVRAERGDHRVRLPVSAGGVIVQPYAAGTPSGAAEQIGGDATLVKKDVLPHITERQPVPPASARRGDVRASLLFGVDRFF